MRLSPRNARLTAALNLGGSGIEYGPLHRTILPKSNYNVRYADYADRETLISHHAKNPNVNTALIPEIDIVTGGNSISAFVDERSVDFIVASHVWEHVPNFIGWLEDNLRILRPGGRIGIAYPDKRYCFDMKRRSTVFSDVLCAYLEQRTQPSFAQLCDHFYNVVSVTTPDIWSGKANADNVRYVHTRHEAAGMLQRQLNNKMYIDCHCWIFEDSEFVHILDELKSVLDVSFNVVAFEPTPNGSNEFYVTLEKPR